MIIYRDESQGKDKKLNFEYNDEEQTTPKDGQGIQI